MQEALDVTRRVEDSHFWFRGFRRFILPLLDDAADGRRDLRLLDCGCGTGHNLRLLQHYGRAYGFDLTPAALAYARDLGARAVHADIGAIPFQSESFDVVTSFDVLQYAQDDQATMTELARLLKRGGRLIVTAAAMPILRGGHAAFWPEVRRYDRARMKRIATGAGLHVERVAYLFSTLFPMLLAARVASRWRATAARDDNDWEMQVPPAPVNAGLTALLRLEAGLGRHMALPFGSSVLLVATKR